MWLMMKDYQSGKKSMTMTGLIVTFFLSCAALIVNLVCLVRSQPTAEGLVWASLGLLSPFAGLYYNKRFKVSSTGIELGGDDEKQDCKDNKVADSA